MRYVSSFERIAQKKGMEKGMEKGIGQGQARLLRALIPHEIAARIEECRPEQLERWALRVLDGEQGFVTVRHFLTFSHGHSWMRTVVFFIAASASGCQPHRIMRRS